MKWLLMVVWLASPGDATEPRATVLAGFPSQKSCFGAIGQLKAQGFKLPLICIEDLAADKTARIPL